ncbi:MAG TPA: DUF3017 domain-containing protein [Marmoricola sp.]|nr:DUF3017 domain-containing protein [Marmoricola sp.]
MTTVPGPEEEGRPVPEHSIAPRKPRTLGGVVYLVVLGVTALGIGVVLLDRWRTGLTVFGGALLCGALARVMIREDNAGMLGIRRKTVDVATLVVLGSGLVVLAAVIPDQPR